MESPHISVLLEESVEFFKDISSGVVVDCTMGYGGHSSKILEINGNINVIGIDRDIEAIDFCKDKFKNEKRISFIHKSFSDGLKDIDPTDIRGIIADLGVSSLQLDKKERGFGFESNALDMRMDNTSPLTAEQVVNSYTEMELADIFFNYGEVRESKKLAREIVNARKIKRITSPRELGEICARCIKGGSINPATLPFQALRIVVNDELGELERGLDIIEGFNDCYVSIITFHSLEDRIVKQRFKKWSQNCICPPEVMRCSCGNNNELGSIITKKPLTAKDAEVRKNKRARSAKLRIFKIR